MDFKNIVINNGKNIKSIIKKITGKENEDLEQEVYIKVFSKKNYKEQGSFKSWINTIAANVSKDYLKSSKVRNEMLLDDEENIIFCNIKDKKPAPDMNLIRKERQEKIIKAINELKPKLRQVINLVEIDNLTYEECAKKLNCPTGTIKSRIYTAKKELAIKLQDLL